MPFYYKWIDKYQEIYTDDNRDEFLLAFSALADMARGNASSIKDLGTETMLKQQQAFKVSAREYGKYQLCRDQNEFGMFLK